MRKCEEMLQRAMENGDLAEIYSDREDTEKFVVARIVALDGEFAAMSCVGSYGGYDGLLVKKLDEIFRVCVDSKYLEAIGLLYTPVDEDFQPEDGEDLRGRLLRYAMENDFAVSIELLGSGNWDVKGFVREVDGGISVSALTSYGEYDGENAFEIEDITEIACDGEDERKLARLAEMRE